MQTVAAAAPPPDRIAPSPAGPHDGPAMARPPRLAGPPLVQTARYFGRPLAFTLDDSRTPGDVFGVQVVGRGVEFFMTRHPDHVKALFTATPDEAPSVTGESPLRPILGTRSVLTATGPRHMRQRKLLLPPFHGDAVAQYESIIVAAITRELDRWTSGETIALAPRMSDVTLEVIMAGVFGITGGAEAGSVEDELRRTLRRTLHVTTLRPWQLVELITLGLDRDRPRGPLALLIRALDRRMYAVIADRRRRGPQPGATDVMSLLIAATDEDGHPLTDQQLRDDLLAIVLAGHETTANQLAWAFERLTRTPDAYRDLRDAVRAGDDDGYVDATIHEAMRVRPVVPLVGRAVQRPWRLGDYGVPAGSVVAANIIALHHRPDLYPDPRRFDPGRFVGRKPGTYRWIPFGGGIRRCLGAALAHSEMRIVLREIARHTDLAADRPRPEGGMSRNVTVIPTRGGRVRVLATR